MIRIRSRPGTPTRLASTALIAVAAIVAGCTSPEASPRPSPAAVASPSPTLAATPSPTPAPTPSAFPLAVVTGMTNLRPAITTAELVELAASQALVVPCGVSVTDPPIEAQTACTAPELVAQTVEAKPDTIALLPPGLVEPATRTLPVDGDGPFGYFGADLFGDPAARALPYPVVGRETAPGAMRPEWIAYDASGVWTMASIGGVCSDRGSAWQALARGRGWAWLFDGGTARYAGPPHLDPSPPAGISAHLVVTPVRTGNDGVLGRLVSGADLTIADVECPIVTDFVPNYGQSLVFSISAEVLPFWRDTFGIDVAYMAANHNTDKGLAGVKSTLDLLPTFGIVGTGVGLDLDQALAPAFVERAGVTVAFVAWNDVPGAWKATATHAGVAWLTRDNVIEGVRRARAGGADLVICDPQWWGGAEYHSDLRNTQLTQLEWFDEAGCDEVVGAGTHFAGPMRLQRLNGRTGLVMASQGNVVFGQDWWQLNQEGIFMTAAFDGTRLVNVHLYPYVMELDARSLLTDPQGDGHYVLERVFANSQVAYLP